MCLIITPTANFGTTAFVLLYITRETLYYINLRYAFLLTPRIANLVSSRTVLFTSVTRDWRDEEWLKADFEKVERVTLVTDCGKLESLVAERDSLVTELEQAELKLITTAVKNKDSNKLQQIGRPGLLTPQYVLEQDRPQKRTFPIFGSKVDVIRSATNDLRELNQSVEEEQEIHQQQKAKKISAAFIQFTTQRAAQQAFQAESEFLTGDMQARSIGTLPEEVLFANLGISRFSRLCRNTLANTFIVLLILFWSIPTGLVTALADLNNLTNQLPFLQFINQIPVPILGAITGLLPAALVAGLLTLVPMISRCKSPEIVRYPYMLIGNRSGNFVWSCHHGRG